MGLTSGNNEVSILTQDSQLLIAQDGSKQKNSINQLAPSSPNSRVIVKIPSGWKFKISCSSQKQKVRIGPSSDFLQQRPQRDLQILSPHFAICQKQETHTGNEVREMKGTKMKSDLLCKKTSSSNIKMKPKNSLSSHKPSLKIVSAKKSGEKSNEASKKFFTSAESKDSIFFDVLEYYMNRNKSYLLWDAVLDARPQSQLKKKMKKRRSNEISCGTIANKKNEQSYSGKTVSNINSKKKVQKMRREQPVAKNKSLILKVHTVQEAVDELVKASKKQVLKNKKIKITKSDSTFLTQIYKNILLYKYFGKCE